MSSSLLITLGMFGVLLGAAISPASITIAVVLIAVSATTGLVGVAEQDSEVQ